MIIQSDIDNILSTKKNSKSKYSDLKKLFETQKIDVFCDFDDTISKNICLLHSKFKYCVKYNKQNVLKNLSNHFKINHKFIEIIKKYNIKKIVIISSNNLDFLKEILSHNQVLLKKLNLEILGIIGNTENFNISKYEKKYILPTDSIYICDISEYSIQKDFPGFLCVDNPNILNYLFIICRKVVFYLLFIVKNV